MKSSQNQELDYVLVNLLSHSTNSPNWELALEYRKIYAAAGTEKNSAKTKNALKFDTNSFKSYGSGVMLYFSLIQTLFYTFVLISILSLPIILSNLKGNGLDIYGNDSFTKTIMRLSLANQRYEEFEKIQADSSIFQDIFVSHATIIMMDILCSLVFFVFLIYWKIKSDQIVEQLISEDALPSYYTLIVKKLPQNYSQQSLIKHFENLGGSIAQISTVYNYQNTLNEIKTLLELVDEYSGSSLQKKQELYHRIQQKYTQMKQIRKKKAPKPVMAIVTFEDMVIKKKIRDIYKYEICPRELAYEGKYIKVNNCKIEPSGIIWENFHLKLSTEIRQGICIYILLAIILIATLVALFLVNARSTSAREHQQKFQEQIDFSKQYTYEEAKVDGSLQAIFNFCSKLNYKTFVFKYHEFCKQYFKSYEQKIGGALFVACLVVGINIICYYIILQLANYRRYKTKTEKSRFLIISLFILYFINTALLIMFIRLQINGYSLGKLITSILSLPSEQFSIEPYNDFNRKWYINIVGQILMIHPVSLVLSPFIQIFIGWFITKVRFYLARRAKTQKEMNQTLKDSEFDFQTFYAMILNCCFFTMFYGNALPILYFLTLLAFFSLYVASYIVFKYFSCKPVMFDHTLNIVISKVLCIALIVHQLTSILYFYTEDIFPLFTQTQKNEIQYYGNKLTHGIFFVLLGICFIVFGVNYSRVCKIVKQFYCQYLKDKGIKKQNKQPKLFSQVFGTDKQDNHYSYLSSYRIEMNPFYLDLCYTMNILKMFDSHFETSYSMHDVLQQRVRSHGNNGNTMSEPVRNNGDYSLTNSCGNDGNEQISEIISYDENIDTERPLH